MFIIKKALDFNQTRSSVQPKPIALMNQSLDCKRVLSTKKKIRLQFQYYLLILVSPPLSLIQSKPNVSFDNSRCYNKHSAGFCFIMTISLDKCKTKRF